MSVREREASITVHCDITVHFYLTPQDEEIAMLGEITHLQAITDDLKVLTVDPHKLPPASEQVRVGGVVVVGGADASGSPVQVFTLRAAGGIVTGGSSSWTFREIFRHLYRGSS